MCFSLGDPPKPCPDFCSQALKRGVVTVDGDGTVPLVSLGGLCRGGWRLGTPLNPGKVKVTTRKYTHELETSRDLPALGAYNPWNPSHQIQRWLKMGRSAPTPPFRCIVLASILFGDWKPKCACFDWPWPRIAFSPESCHHR